jgi:WD40 repeat protein
VRREIVQFKLLGKAGRILPIIVDGEPGAAERPGPTVDAGLECFPRPLRRGVPVQGRTDRHGRALIDWRARAELLAADLRPENRPGQGYTSAAAYRAELEKHNESLPKAQQVSAQAIRQAERRYARQLGQQKLKIISGLLGVDLGELTRRDAAARARRLKRLLILSVSVLLIVVALALAAVYQGLVASSNLAASRYTLSHVESEEHGEPGKALLLAAAALDAVPLIDPLVDVYARRTEMLALASPRQMKVADRAQIAVFSPRFDKVATLDGGRIQITDLRTGEALRVPSLTEAEAKVAAFAIPAFSPDGSQFITGTGTNTARIWRLQDGRSVSVKTPDVVVRGTLQSQFFFSPNGRAAMGWVGVETGDEDGQHVQAAWDADSGAEASVAALGAAFRFGELAWSRNPARNWSAVLLGQGRLQVIDVSTGAAVSPEFGPAAEQAEVVSFAFSADAGWLVTQSRSEQQEGYELQLWSARDGRPVETPPMRSAERLQIQDVSADGRQVLAAPDRGRDPAPLQLWEFGRPSYPLPYRELGTLPSAQTFWPQTRGRSRLASICGDTGLVAAVSTEATPWTGQGPRVQSAFSVRLWHTETAQELTRSIRGAGGLIAWSVSPDGREIATVSADGVVSVTNLFWHEPTAATTTSATASDSRTDRAWFSADRRSVITGSLEGVRHVGGMPTSAGTPTLLLRHWRLPGLEPLWAQPVQLTGDPMSLASTMIGFSTDGRQIAIGTSEVRLFEAGSGAPSSRPFAVSGRLVGLVLTGDGSGLAIASEAANSQGRTVYRIAQWQLDSGKELESAAVEWPAYGNAGARSDFAGFTADGRYFLRVSAGDRFTGDWSSVVQLDLLDLTTSPALHLQFSRESPAPPALIAAVMQSATGFERESPDAVIASLPGARVRIRAVLSGATLEHVEARRSIVAPAGRVDTTAPPVLSGDARWIATPASGRREVRVWSAFSGMPSSEPLVRHTELVAMAFDPGARQLWQIGRDGGPRTTYVGAERSRKPVWLSGVGEALTGMRLTGQGVGVEWLGAGPRRAAQEEMLRAVSDDAADGDPGAVQLRERLTGMLVRR